MSDYKISYDFDSSSGMANESPSDAEEWRAEKRKYGEESTYAREWRVKK